MMNSSEVPRPPSHGGDDSTTKWSNSPDYSSLWRCAKDLNSTTKWSNSSDYSDTWRCAKHLNSSSWAARFAAVVVAALSACIDPTIPDGALISCQSDAECPAGFVCQDGRGRCVAQQALDETAPALVGVPVLDPERGTTGTTFTLSFDVNEALLSDPVVVVDIGGADAVFAVDAEASDTAALHHVFTYTATGAEAPDRPSPVRITLTDRSENLAADLAGGVIVFDFSAPAFLGAPVIFDASSPQDPPVAASFFGPDATIGVTFQTTEGLAVGGATVEMVPLAGGIPVVLDHQDGTDQLFFHPMSEDDVDGDYIVEARLTDASGNISDALAIGLITLDLTPPAIQSGASVRTVPDVSVRGDALLDVRAASVIEVVFITSEPLGSAPRVFVRCGDVEVDMVRIGDTASSIVFVERLDGLAGLPEGDCDIRADVTDGVGNVAVAASVLAPAFTLDTSAPAAPAVDVDDAIVYTRTPWGSDTTAGQKRFTVVGNAAVEPFATLAVYEAEGADPEDAVSHVDADSGGSFSLTLNPVDRAVLFVSQIDPAGNEGPRARVRDVVWVATMGGKVAGSAFVNPHRFESRALFTPHLAQGAIVELGPQAARSDRVTAATTGAATWQDATERTANPDVELPMMTYDPARGRLVLFGGASCSCGAGGGIASCIDTFERNGVRWTAPAVADPEGDGSPPAQQGAAMVFDTSRGVSVLIGAGGADDVWEWNGVSWRRACDAGCAVGGPLPRQRLAAAYDPVRRRTVVFGGRTGAGMSDETWEWNGQGWQRQCPGGGCITPPARAAHAMAYDEAIGGVVLFGGDTVGVIDGAFTNDGGLSNDVWVWDGATWTELCTDRACALSKPTARLDAAMVFDDAAGVMVMHGGLSAASSSCDDESLPFEDRQLFALLGDTVTFDGTVFTAQAVADPEVDGDPGVRRRHGMSWDSLRQRVVLVGGVADEPCAALECSHFNARDTWEWDGASWRKFVDAPQPSERDGVSAAFDASTRQEVLLVGGGGSIFRFGERWRTSGSLTTVEGRVSTSDDGALLFGGLSGGTPTAFTGFAQDANFFPLLCFRPPCPPSPPARHLHASAESPLGGTTIFGGSLAANPFDAVSSDTWQFTNRWTEACVGCTDAVSRPDPRFNSAMSFDVDRRLNVLFAGQPFGVPVPLADTWEWNGTAWTKRTPVGPAPPGRAEHTLTWDQRRHRTILFGGFASGFFGVNCGNGRSECDDLWEWDGTAWTKPPIVDVELDGSPGARHNHAMAYSPRINRNVMFGGGGDAETWLYNAGGGERPGQVMGAAFAAAGTDGDEQILDVAARFSSGGTGDGGDGARLFIWDVDGWRALAENGAGAAAPDDVAWRHTETPLDPGEVLSRVFFGTERTLFFAVAPVVPNGGRPDFGRLETDAAEISVRYRLP